MKSKTPPLTRRQFLANSTKTASVVAVGNLFWRAQRTAAEPRRLSANDKLNIAFIGVAGRGGNNITEITGAEEVNVVGLCDVDETNLNSAGAKFPAAKRYRDFRKLLETEKSLDAVAISIPDHVHAPACMMALKLGKHV